MRLQAVIVFSSVVIQRLSILVMTVLAARLMGAAELGKFAIIYATCVNLTGFIGDGLAATINREIPLAGQRSREAQYETAGMVLSFCVTLAVTMCILSIVFAPMLSLVVSGDEGLTVYLRISSLMTLCLLPNTLINALFNVFGKNLSAAIVASGGAMISVVFGLFGAMQGGAFGMCVGVACAMMLLTLTYCVLLRCYFSRVAVSLAALHNNFRSGIFSRLTLPTMGAMAFGGPVHWLCMSFLGTSPSGVKEVAIFSAIFQWYSILTFIPSALMNFTIPWLARANAKDEMQFRRRARHVVFAMLAMVGLLLTAVVLFKSHILALYGADFTQEGGVLVLLAVCGFVAAFITVMNQVAWAAGKSWSNLMTAVIYGVAYISSAFVFIKILHFGASGLAWSILIASLIQGVLQIRFFFTRKYKTGGI